MDEGIQPSPCDILDGVTLHMYESGMFVNLVQKELKNMGFVMVPGGTKPSVNATKEEGTLLKEDHYVRSVHVSKTKICVFFQLTDEGKHIVLKDRHQKAYAAHLLYPMSSDINNLEKNQRVYVNVGFRGDPIPHVVGVYETCVCIDRLKIKRKIYYKFRHISHAFSGGDELMSTTFLVPMNQKSRRIISTEAMNSDHHLHTPSRRKLYTTVGLYALGFP